MQITGIVDLPTLSPAVTLNEQPESLFGLAEKYVAVESLVYLTNQITELRPFILEFLPKDKRVIFEEYESQVSFARPFCFFSSQPLNFLFAQTLSAIKDVRRPVYLPTAKRSINSEVILQLMSKVSWDLKEVKSQHSQYVEILLRVSCQNVPFI